MGSKRLTVRFLGKVQGVGFRFAVNRVASNHEIVGFVRNEPDGTVLMEAEGREEELESLLRGIRSSAVGGYIEEARECWGEALRSFEKFGIRFY